MEQIYPSSSQNIASESSEFIQLHEIITNLPEAVKIKLRLKEVFSVINRMITEGSEYEEILDSIFETLRQIIPFDRIGIALIKNEGKDIQLKWVKSHLPITYLEEDYEAPLDDSSLNPVIYSRKPRIINDLSKYFEEHPHSKSTEFILRDGIKSKLTCPIIYEGAPVGVIFFSSAHPGTYNQNHVEIFCEISQSLSVIIAQKIFKEGKVMIDAKEKMFQGTLHDLNNPLMIINNVLEMIITKPRFKELGDDSRKLFLTLRRNCDSMINLVRQIVYTERYQQDQIHSVIEKVHLETFISEILDDATAMAKQKHIYVFHLIGQQLPTTLEFAPGIIKQALDNLLANSVKYSKEESSITISIDYDRKKRRLTLVVDDESIGIPSEKLSHLFEEKEIPPLSSSGLLSSGKGLPNVRRLISMVAGEVFIGRNSPKGTSIGFWIPVEEADKIHH